MAKDSKRRTRKPFEALRIAVHAAAYVQRYREIEVSGHYDMAMPEAHAVVDEHAADMADDAVRARRKALRARRSSVPPPSPVLVDGLLAALDEEKP